MLFTAAPLLAQPATPLKTHLDGVTIELFAESPQVRTPTGIEVDRRGRVYCIESHTHFRPENYAGPEHDRIQVYEDTDHDGRADRITTFHEGFTHGMDLAFASAPGNDGALYLATRSEILRLADTDNDGKADDVKTIAKLITPGVYPHNGLSGLAFDRDGGLYFGLGENLGAPYKLVGTDDTTLSGEGEGGSVYHIQGDGTKLRRVATGFWNPWGMCVDNFGNVFATDNDPGSSPPCRLLHVVEGGDYGYEYRYGRNGLHPFQSWNGELPGTLPMVTGTGEAPCEIVALPDGTLLLASWADHRIERYHLKPRGISFGADREIIVSGGGDFRPVGIALAPDGSYYVSDWVDGSYELHGQGRIWRMKLPEMDKRTTPLPLVDSEDFDPFLFHRDVMRKSQKNPDELLDRAARSFPPDPLRWVLALRRSGRADVGKVIPQLMRFKDPQVRFLALKWVADEKLHQFRPLVEQGLNDPSLTLPLFMAHLAVLERLDLSNDELIKRRQIDPELLLGKVFDEAAPPLIRSYALRLLPPDLGRLKVAKLLPLLDTGDEQLALEVVRTIRHGVDPDRFDALKRIAMDSSRPTALRAEAVAGLAGAPAPEITDTLITLATSSEPALRDEALRSLIGSPLGNDQRTKLQTLDKSQTVTRLLNGSIGARPTLDHIAAWLTSVKAAPADPDAGRRIFFGKTTGTCGNCHMYEGRGTRVGPDLTTIARRADPRYLLESMLQPNKEIAPQYLPWQIHTVDGRTLVGIGMRKGGNQEIYMGIDGKEFSVKLDQLKSREELPTSLMPPALPLMMTDQELRDLIAFLLHK